MSGKDTTSPPRWLRDVPRVVRHRLPLLSIEDRLCAHTTFLRTEHVAERVGVDASVVAAWIQAHDLPAFKMPGRCVWQIVAADLIDFMDRRWPELDFGAPEPLWDGPYWSRFTSIERVALLTQLLSPQEAWRRFELTMSSTTDLWAFVKGGHIRARKAMLRRRRYSIVAADLIHFTDHQAVGLAVAS